MSCTVAMRNVQQRGKTNKQTNKKTKTVFNNEHLNVLMFIQEWRAGSGVCHINYTGGRKKKFKKIIILKPCKKKT